MKCVALIKHDFVKANVEFLIFSQIRHIYIFGTGSGEKAKVMYNKF